MSYYALVLLLKLLTGPQVTADMWEEREARSQNAHSMIGYLPQDNLKQHRIWHCLIEVYNVFVFYFLF